MLYSAYQIALFDCAENEDCSIIIDAVAGSGKTTSIVETCNRLVKKARREGKAMPRILFLAFNVDIVKSLRAKLPSEIICQTFNACGWSAWRRFTGKKMIQVEVGKTKQIIKDRFEENDQKLYAAYVTKMVALAKSFGLKPDDGDDKWFEIQNRHCVEIDSEDPAVDYNRAVYLCKQTLKVSIARAGSICDFDDQIYMPWLNSAAFDKYDIVFIDEAQDTSGVQKQLLARMLKPGGRLIAVGDPHQAIYGFRGADSDSMNQIQVAFNAKRMPLSISYRCSQAVVMEAKKHVPHIEASPTAPIGLVETVEKYGIDSFGNSDAIICRNNAPLVKMAFSIISRGRSVNFLGRDLGAGLIAMIERMDAENVEEVSELLNQWFARESVKLEKQGKENQIEAMKDRIDCVEVFISHLPEGRRTIRDLTGAIENLFKSSGPGITLCSAHKSKGLEWDNVFILDPNLMPSKWATRQEWMMEQEENLIYVAITRAKLNLRYIVSDQWTDNPRLHLEMKDRPAPVPAATTSSKPKRGRQPKMEAFNPFK